MASNPFDYAERFNRPRREQSTQIPADPLAAEIDRMRDEQVQATFAALPEPDRAAKVTRLAREADVSPLMVEDDPDSVEQALRSRKFSDVTRTYPAISRFVLANPRGAAAAQDDAKSLGFLGEAFDGLKRLGKAAVGQLDAGRLWAAGMGWDALATADEALTTLTYPVAAARATVAGAFGINDDPDKAAAARQKFLRGAGKQVSAAREERSERDKFGNYWVDGVLAGLQSAPAMVAGALLRNPTAAASVLGGGTAAEGYQSALRAGASKGAAIRYGATTGFAEGALEKMPISRLGEMIANKTPWGKAFVKQLATEMPAEQVTTVLQNISAYAYLPENAGKTAGDFIAEMPGAALDTALATAGGVTATTGTIAAARRATDATAAVMGRVQEARQAKAERQFIDKAEKAATDSKLRQRDPEAFRALLKEQAEDAGARNVFIPAEAIRAYQQSDSYDADMDPFDQGGFEEAMAAGGDYVMPIEDALTDLVGTPAWEAIKDDLRLTGGGISTKEAATFESEMEALVEQMSDQAAEQERADAPGRTIREGLIEKVALQLGGAGFTSPVARQYAELLTTRAQSRAARLGKELEGVEFNNLRIVGVDRAVAGDALANERGNQAAPLQAHVDGSRLDAHQVSDVAIGEALRPEADGLLSVPSLVTVLSAVQSATAVDAQILDRVVELIPVDVMDNLSITKGAAKGLLGNKAMLENAAALDAQLPVTGGGDSAATVRLLVSEIARVAAEDIRTLLAAGESAEGGSAVVTNEVRQLNDSSQERAMIQFKGEFGADTSSITITLFENRNLTSFLHETAHMWLEELMFDASLPDAPDQLKADAEAVKAYFAANGHAMDGGFIPTEAHELWARSGERYFMEGKAPSSALVRLFESFRAWLIGIYKVVDRLRAPITPEIREVFDRLIATDEEIAAAQERQALGALFKDAATIGMSAAEFAAYQQQVDDARSGAHASLIDKTMKAVRRRETERYRKARKGVVAEEKERIDASPIYRAIAMMRDTRISKEWIEDTLGLDAPGLLPVRVPPLYVEGGTDPQVIAELAGYANARDMIEALIGAERAHRQAKEGGDKRSMRQRAIDTAADAEMLRRYGDPLNDGSIEREALAAVHSEMQGEVIASELRVLSRRTGNRPTPYRIAREWARAKVRQGIVADEASAGAIQRYARNAAKAGRAAEEAMLKQDVGEAFRQKQFQMMNNALVAEAKVAADEVDVAVRRMDKIARVRTRKSVDQDYLEQAQALLEAVDLRRRSQVSIDRKDSFEKWAASRPEGEEVFIPDRFDWSGTNWTRLSVESLLALNDTVQSILHLGRKKQEMLDNQERRNFEEWKDEALGTLEETPGRKLTNELGDPSRPVAGVFANLMKMEVFAAEMDNDRPNGAWSRLLVGRGTEAANYRDEQRDIALNPVAEAYNALPAKMRDKLAERITVPEMLFRSADINDPRNGTPRVLTRWEVVGMAMNLGTESNLDKLSRGYGILPATAEQIVSRELSQEEWAFVTTVWRSLNKLQPHIVRAEKEMSGVEPEWQEPRQVVTPFGTIDGGYYPAVYDPAQSQRAEDNSTNEANDLFGKRSGVATAKGHTISRTDYAAPMLLSPEQVLFTHVEKVITRNAYAPWARDVLKAVKNPAVRSAIDRKFGPEFRQQIEPWLHQQVREGITNETGARFAERFLRSARVNLTVVAMGLRWSTGVAQTIGLANSAGRIGLNNLRKGMQRLLRNPSAATEFVFARSPEMMRRNEAMNRDVAEAFRQMRKARIGGNALTRNAAQWQAKAQAFAFWHIGMIDRYVVSIPTWLGAYEKSINAGMDDPAASAAADKAVRLSQGSGREKDLSAWQSNQVSEGLRFFTMFYTPFNVLLNAQWEMGRSVRRGDYRKAASLAFWFLIATPLLEAMLAGDVPDEDDEEGWAMWLARNVGAYQLAGIPVIRDAANYAERKAIGEYATFSPGPIGRIFDASEDAATLAWDSTFGEDEVSDRWLRTAIETPGYFLGLPTGQVAATANFMKDASTGEADPETFGDWYQGLTKGKLAED